MFEYRQRARTGAAATAALAEDDEEEEDKGRMSKDAFLKPKKRGSMEFADGIWLCKAGKLAGLVRTVYLSLYGPTRRRNMPMLIHMNNKAM